MFELHCPSLVTHLVLLLLHVYFFPFCPSGGILKQNIINVNATEQNFPWWRNTYP